MERSRPRVLVVLPTEWDQAQIRPWLAAHHHYEAVLGTLTDANCPADLDPLAYAETLSSTFGGQVDGVTTSSDDPGATLAALVAARLGLPGALPERLVRAAHKYYARLDQRRVAPDAVPPFVLLEPGRPLPEPFPLAFPCFVKPVKGAFSRHARRVEGLDDLRRFLDAPEVRAHASTYVAIYNRLVAALTDLDHDGGAFLAEGLLGGRQVTVEGFLTGGKATILGTVDTRLHPGTNSFERFDYPSELPSAILARLEHTAARVAEASGLDQTLFNVEITVEPSTGQVGIVEMNTRMCGQFADLYEKVDGTNGYEVAFELALGRVPRVRRREGAFAAAASIPLRTFRPVRVLAAPDRDRIAAAAASLPGTIIVNECAPGDELARFEDEDGASIRFGVLNLGGDSRADLHARAVALVAHLGYRFEPLPGARGA